MTVGPNATKKNVLEQLLDQGMVLVALDARVAGVDVPAHLGKDPQLRLNLSYRFGLPMEVDEWGVAATLTFAGVPYNCRFPWAAIFLMVSHVSGQPYLFPDDIPAELLTQGGSDAPAVDGAGAQHRTVEADDGSPTAPGGRPKLTLISSSESEAPESDGAAPAASSTASDETPPPRRPRRRGHLRLVK